MLSYNDFEKNIQLIQEYYDKDDQLTTILNVEGFVAYSGLIIDALIALLEEVMEDTENHWINYWCWDCDFGAEGENRVKIDDHYIEFSTIKDLYFVLLGNKSKRSE